MTDEKRAQKFLNKDFGVVQFKFNRWSLELAPDQDVESVFDRAAWVNLAPVIMGHDKSRGRGDIIEIRNLATGLYAEVMVQEIGPGFVKVVPIRAFEPKAVELPESSPLETRWNVGARAHEVIRKADKQVMRGGFQTKESAAAWIAEHLQAMKAA